MRPDRRRISRVAARWMILGEWRAHPTRVLVAAVAIAVGVALGFAVHLVNASAVGEFDRAVAALNGDADLQVQATSDRGFDEGLYPRLARVGGVQAASPVIRLAAAADRQTLVLLGLDVLRAASVTPALATPPGDGPFDDRAAWLSPAMLGTREIGAVIDLTAAGRTASFTIAGVLPGVTDDQRLAVVDIAAAQWRFGQLGRLQRVDLKLRADANADEVRAAVQAMLPADAELVTARTEARRSDSLSRAYRVNLEMLALVALLTGAFLIYSAQSLSVARRRAQFALLRVLGAEPRALVAQVVVEGLAVGLVGAIAGLALGLGLAGAALRILGGDLGGGYFAGGRTALVFAPGAALTFLALGLLAALIGSVLPAREAALAEPAVALKNAGDAIDPNVAPRLWPALLLLALGGLATQAPAVAGLPVLGYVAIALVLAGGVAAMPWIARVLLSPLSSRTFSLVALDLAVKRLWGAPSQAAVALCGIVASTSLMIAMAVMVASFRGSVDEWLIQILPADIYLRVDEAGAGLPPESQARLAQVPGVTDITFAGSVALRLAADKPPVILAARPIDPADPAAALPLIGAGQSAPTGATPVWVSEPAAWLYGYKPGDRIALPLPGQAARTPVVVAGVWRDYARQHGAIAMAASDYTRLTGDRLRSEAAIRLAPGSNAQAVTAALRAALPAGLAGRVTFAQARDLRALALSIFDRSFLVTYLLEAIAVMVGLTGVAATLSAQTLARTKEFGMLRHIGVSTRQIIGMLAAEGALLGLIGGAAGLLLGLAMSQVLIHVVNPQSFHWTMQTKIPLPLFAGVAAALVAASAGAAVLAGRRAVSTNALLAVREDW